MRTLRAFLFILLALVAGNDFLLQSTLSFDHGGITVGHLAALPILSVDADDGDEHPLPVPVGGGLDGALILLLALVLTRAQARSAAASRPALLSPVAAAVRVAAPRGPPFGLARA